MPSDPAVAPAELREARASASLDGDTFTAPLPHEAVQVAVPDHVLRDLGLPPSPPDAPEET